MNNEVLDLSFKFSVKIIQLCKRHNSLRVRFYPIYNQLLKSATSIGANVEEATGAQSKRDFLSKMYIAFKEAKETHYWLRLISETNIINETELQTLLEDSTSLKNLLAAITKKTRNNL
jgi:four helix bundle protein